MIDADPLVRDLPDPESAKRFLDQFAEKHPSQFKKLSKNKALESDVLTLVSFSPLLAATLLQNPEYLWWLNRKRSEGTVRDKQELLESLARFSMTNSQVETNVLLSRFRRRELLRIFLRDIRRLATIAEITEEISNLADAVLENALRVARQELDNRYGSPLETDDKGRRKPAEFCIVSLGKLGSKELNYSSDIDLLFIYSGEGSTSGSGSKGTVTNREYFVKLAESITKLVGGQSGEGAAYRVDMRLRPHGRVGPLAMSLRETVKYYCSEAATWERQVLIRSRSSAGSDHIFKSFFLQVENTVFASEQDVADALDNVRRSKQKIDLEQRVRSGFDVKLGIGGIREIEFIAQALQLAFGGRDNWLRSPHTLISLTRLADRGHLHESELTELFDAYDFLRHLEHILQMENGLQTHTVSEEPASREVLARRMRCERPTEFEAKLSTHTANVNRVFRRVFSDFRENEDESQIEQRTASTAKVFSETILLDGQTEPSDEIRRIVETSPRFAEIVAADPEILNQLPDINGDFPDRDYSSILTEAVFAWDDLRLQLSALRMTWHRLLSEILAFDVLGKTTLKKTKALQTSLAEASIETALRITKFELERRFANEIGRFSFAVMGLGKLGGGGVDYDSDLDLVMVYDNTQMPPVAKSEITLLEFYTRTVEIFVNTLSAMTREGSLYRVDLRLRPHGKDGALAISHTAFSEYMRTKSAVWELLAFVKLRGVGGDPGIARSVEAEIRDIIHAKAKKIDAHELSAETRRIRLSLEKLRSDARRRLDIDIKYGQGGMLDIYFAIRFLQLRDNVPDDDASRSTDLTLAKLKYAGSLSDENFAKLLGGYEFLSKLDHDLRLTVGRTTRLPLANKHALSIIAERMKMASVESLLESVTAHRLDIRSAFDSIVE
ncbi:MAG: hypothetical protein ACT4O9_05040 [Blastocatellia bacterium]